MIGMDTSRQDEELRLINSSMGEQDACSGASGC